MPQYPPFIQFVMDEYLKPLNPTSADDVLLLDLLVYLSRMFCHYRVKVKGPKIDLYPNLYGITFLPSGAGKDRPLAHLNALFAKVFESQRKEYAEFRKEEETRLLKEAESRGWGKQACAEFAAGHRSTEMTEEIGDATPEGIVSLGSAFTLAGFGSLYFANSEFIDFIEERNSVKTMLISYLKDVYEDGTNRAKLIKSEKRRQNVRGVPHTMLVHSSLAGLLKNEKANQSLKDFLNRGLGRRSLVCYPEKYFHFEETTLEKEQQEAERAEKALAYLSDHLVSLQKNYAFGAWTQQLRHLTLSSEAQKRLLAYNNETKRSYADLSSYEDEAVSGDLLDQPRKAIRLAAIIALTRIQSPNNPEELKIAEEELAWAIHFVNTRGKDAKRLANRRETDELIRIRKEILEFQGEKAITKMFFRELPFAPSKGKRSQWIEDALRDLPDICAEHDEAFVVTPYKTTLQYRILQHHTAAGDAPIVLSFSKGDGTEHPVAGYEKKQTTLSELPALLKQFAYAPAIFKDGYRKEEHIAEFGNCVIVDVDGGLTLENAQSLIAAKDFSACIITSRNHQKEKRTASGSVYPACDRFRIIFPCKEPLAPVHGYTAMMKNIFRYLELEKYADEKATDPARFFFPSPELAVAWTHTGTKLLNWRMFDMEKIERKRTFRSGLTGKAEITVTGTLPNAAGHESRHEAMVKYGSQFGAKYQFLNPQATPEETQEATRRFLSDWNANYPPEPVSSADVDRFVDEWLAKKLPEWKSV